MGKEREQQGKQLPPIIPEWIAGNIHTPIAGYEEKERDGVRISTEEALAITRGQYTDWAREFFFDQGMSPDDIISFFKEISQATDDSANWTPGTPVESDGS